MMTSDRWEIPPEYKHASKQMIVPWFKELVTAYTADMPARWRRREGVFLAGTNGCGKTQTACAMAQMLQQQRGGGNVMFIPSYELLGLVYAPFGKSPIMMDTHETFDELVESASILIIDDLGYEIGPVLKDRESKYIRLLRSRLAQRRGKITMVTTNLPLEDDKAMDEAIGSTLASVLDRVCRYQQYAEETDLRAVTRQRFPLKDDAK